MEYKLIYGTSLLSTQLLVANSKDEEILGEGKSDRWFPFLLDVSKVAGVRLYTDEEDSIGYNKPLVYLDNNDSMVLNIDLEEFAKLLIEVKTYDGFFTEEETSEEEFGESS
jgi:hypothetical protein